MKQYDWNSVEDVKAALAAGDLQPIFDRAVTFIADQRQPSINPEAQPEAEERCAYRGGADGELRCAAGALIPDAAYRPDLEGLSVDFAFVEADLIPVTGKGDAVGGRRWRVMELLRQLQNAHDNAVESGDFRDEWIQSCRKIAKAQKLTMATV